MVDPYVDATTGVLRNRLGIADATELARVEAQVAAAAELTLYREARSGGRHDLDQLRAVHRKLFGDIYDWAGELRTVDIAKGQTLFALAVHIDSEGHRIFRQLEEKDFLRGLSRPDFVRGAARLLGDLNALHPFREGNGRAQRAFVQLLARDAGWRMAWAKVGPELNASQSVAAMHDPDAFAPLLDDIVVRVGEPLSSETMVLPRPLESEPGEGPDAPQMGSAATLFAPPWPAGNRWGRGSARLPSLGGQRRRHGAPGPALSPPSPTPPPPPPTRTESQPGPQLHSPL